MATWAAGLGCGLVVCGDSPEAMARVRAVSGDAPLLVPGIGARRGMRKRGLDYALDSRGRGAVFSVSRDILYASRGDDWLEAAGRAAVSFRDGINLAVEPGRRRGLRPTGWYLP